MLLASPYILYIHFGVSEVFEAMRVAVPCFLWRPFHRGGAGPYLEAGTNGVPSGLVGCKAWQLPGAVAPLLKRGGNRRRGLCTSHSRAMATDYHSVNLTVSPYINSSTASILYPPMGLEIIIHSTSRRDIILRCLWPS